MINKLRVYKPSGIRRFLVCGLFNRELVNGNWKPWPHQHLWLWRAAGNSCCSPIGRDLRGPKGAVPAAESRPPALGGAPSRRGEAAESHCLLTQCPLSHFPRLFQLYIKNSLCTGNKGSHLMEKPNPGHEEASRPRRAGPLLHRQGGRAASLQSVRPPPPGTGACLLRSNPCIRMYLKLLLLCSVV